MIDTTCPDCGVEFLPHLSECTFSEDCPEACSDFEKVALLRAEIARLRLTGAEREAVEHFAVIDGPQYLPQTTDAAATLRGLLERTGGGR